MRTVFFDMSIVIASTGRVKGLSVAYPVFPLALIAAAGLLVGAGTEAAWGGAWLLPPGDGQVIADTFFSDSTHAFNAQGHLIPVPSYKKFELGPISNMA